MFCSVRPRLAGRRKASGPSGAPSTISLLSPLLRELLQELKETLMGKVQKVAEMLRCPELEAEIRMVIPSE